MEVPLLPSFLLLLVVLQGNGSDRDWDAAAAAIRPGMVRIRHTTSSSCIMWPTVAHPSALPVAQRPLGPKPKPLDFSLEPFVAGQGFGDVPNDRCEGFRAGCKLVLKLQAVTEDGRAVPEPSKGLENIEKNGQGVETGKGQGSRRAGTGTKIRVRLRSGKAKEGGGAGAQPEGSAGASKPAAAAAGVSHEAVKEQKRWCCVGPQGWVVGAVPGAVMEKLLGGHPHMAGAEDRGAKPGSKHEGEEDKELRRSPGPSSGRKAPGLEQTQAAAGSPGALNTDREKAVMFEVVVRSLRYSSSTELQLEQHKQVADGWTEGCKPSGSSKRLASVLVRLMS